MCSSVDVSAEPHRFVPGRAPPHFTRYAGWVGGDAGLSGVHIAVHLDGIFYTALVWIHPVFPYTRKWLIDSLQSYDNKINQQGSLSHRSKSPCTDNISWFIMFETIHRKKNRKNNHWHTTIYRFPVKKKRKEKKENTYFPNTHFLPLISVTPLTHHSSSWGSISSGRHRSWQDVSCCHQGSSCCRSGCWGPSAWPECSGPRARWWRSCCWA